MKKLILFITFLPSLLFASGIPYVLNFNGNATNLTAPQVATANIYVRTNGNDATAARNTQNAFGTLSNAFLAALPGDVIDMGPGIFGLTNSLIMQSNATLRGAGPWTTWIQVDLAISNVMVNVTQYDWIRMTNGNTFKGFAITKSPAYYGVTPVNGYPFACRFGSGFKNTTVTWEDVDWIGENDTIKFGESGNQLNFNRVHIRNYNDGFLLINGGQSNHIVFRNSSMITTIETNVTANFFNFTPVVTGFQCGGSIDLIDSFVAQVNIEKLNPVGEGEAVVWGDYINCYNSSFFSTINAATVNANDSSSGLFMQCLGNNANDYINIYDGYVPSNRVDAVQLGDGSGNVNYYGLATTNYWNQLDFLTTVPGLSTNVNTGATHLFFTNGILVKITIP